jgi:excisionase family DNA binding protein
MTTKNDLFYTFDETLERLSIKENTLKRLVSEGEIRAFREGDQMKFRRSDVENLDISPDNLPIQEFVGGEVLTDDLIFFDEGDDLDLTCAEFPENRSFGEGEQPDVTPQVAPPRRPIPSTPSTSKAPLVIAIISLVVSLVSFIISIGR